MKYQNETNLSRSFFCSSQLLKVSRIICHHGYDTKTKESDVALLKLEHPLVFNEFVRPIDIWMSPLPDLMKCTITGWGSTRESQNLSDQ